LLNCALDAVAVHRVGVLVPGDDEACPALEAAGLAGIVGDVPAAARNVVVGPEADLVVIAGAVAIFGAAETAFLTAGMDGFFTDNPTPVWPPSTTSRTTLTTAECARRDSNPRPAD
jgi:hypothetical protein